MSTCANCGHKSDGDVKFCPACGTRVVSVEAQGDPLLGKTLSGKYRVIAEIGSGSMGTVYRGEHIGLHKKIALKILHPDLNVSDESMQRFQREGIAAGSFSHPNAIQIFDFDRAEDRYVYLALEYVEGPNLKVYLQEAGPLSSTVAVQLIRQVLSALAEAHSQGIIHRDLKPDNIMVVTNAAGELSIKVLDFGLSKLVDRPMDSSLQTQTGRIMGTPLYMSPEQWAGSDVDGRSDLYSAGLILYEMLSCHHPFRGSTITETMVKSTSQKAPSLADSHPDLEVPAGVEKVLDRAMQKRRGERYESASQMIIDLDAVDYGLIAVGDQAKVSQIQSRPHQTVQPRIESSKRTGIWVAALGTALAILGGWVMFGGGSFGLEADVPRASMKNPADRSTEEVTYLAHLATARQNLRERDYSKAHVRVMVALDSSVVDSEAHLLRAKINIAQGDREDAALDLAAALELDDGYVEAAVEFGWLHLDNRDLAAADAQFRSVSDLPGGTEASRGGMGALALFRREHASAREILTAACESLSASSRDYLYLGRCLLAFQESGEAVKALQQAKRHDPQSWAVVAKLGEAYLEAGELASAERELRNAIRLDSGASITAQGTLASLLVDQSRYDDALEVCDATLRRHPDNGRLLILKGAAEHGLGNPVPAIASLQAGLKRNPDAAGHILLGLLYQGQGDLTAAVTQYDAALGIDGASAVAQLHLGMARFAQGRYEEAGRRLQSAVDRDPDSVLARFSLGIYLMDFAEDPSVAVPHLESYKRLGGTDARVDAWLLELRR